MANALKAEVLVKKLKRAKKTIAVVESITGGGLAHVITEVPGASEVFLGGVVAYSDSIKRKKLKISSTLLKKESSVSESVVRKMAEEIRSDFGSDYGIATSGVAGPGPAYGKKAGTVWIAIASKKETIAFELAIKGDRSAVRHATIESAIATLERILTP